MRINLTKKDLVNLIYMQVGFSKQITENLVEEFFSIIVLNLSKKKSYKNILVFDDDIIFDKAIIDKQSLDIIAGSIVDFKKEMIGESFSIKNPKASASCGCGLSFSV